MKGHLRTVLKIAVAAFALFSLACETLPARAYRGARHYAAGSDALSLGENARAVAELERAAVLVPDASEVQNHLGLAYWAEGRLGEAQNAFETALDLDCDNRAARQNLDQLSSLAPERDSSILPSSEASNKASNKASRVPWLDPLED